MKISCIVNVTDAMGFIAVSLLHWWSTTPCRLFKSYQPCFYCEIHDAYNYHRCQSSPQHSASESSKENGDHLCTFTL